jgi:nicotinamidase/pyrazinamidase
MKNALILVDLQNDFLPGGTLPVNHGDEIIPVINQLLTCPFDVKVASQDWHPKNHGSFASTHGKDIGEHILLQNTDQILWPDHCIQDSFGAEISKDIHVQHLEKIFHKGTSLNVDSYSAFFDNAHLKSTGLFEYLKERGVEEVFIAGLAMDYCVKYSVLHALELKFKTHVIVDACKAVNLKTNDEFLSLQEMRNAGAILDYSKDILSGAILHV